MRDRSATAQEWCLQVRFFENSESALFPSRQEALEHAQALMKDYGESIGIELVVLWGRKEILRESPFITRDGTD